MSVTNDVFRVQPFPTLLYTTIPRNSYSTSHRERALGASRALAEERAAPASMVHVRFPNLGEACTAFYNEPVSKVTIGVVSVTELRAPEGIGPDVKTRPRRGTLHIEHERRNTPRTCLPGLLFEWDENMARDCKLFQPLDMGFVEDSKGLFAEVECTMVLVSPSNLSGGRRLLDQTRPWTRTSCAYAPMACRAYSTTQRRGRRS